MENPYEPPSTSPLSINEDSDKSLKLASRWKRLFASLIDSVISAVVIWAAILLIFQYKPAEVGNMSTENQVYLTLFGIFAFLVIHGYLLASNGQTIGKKILKIRVVTMNGEVPKFLPLILRRYAPIWAIVNVPVVGGLLNLINICFIFREDKRCVHDLIAGTQVVNA